ncbi:FAD-dependent oxidoreductase [Microbacterium sp. HJ5]
MKRVVIVGGGYAGVALARHLDAAHEVVLVEQRERFAHVVAGLRAIAGASGGRQLLLPYSEVLQRGTVLHAAATAVRDGGVEVAGKWMPADAVAIATGSSYPSPIKPEGSDLAGYLLGLDAAAEAVSRSASIVVAGAGAVGVELAAEIRHAHPGRRVTLIGRRLIPGPYRHALRRRLHRKLTDLGVTVLEDSLIQDAAGAPAAPSATYSPGQRVRTTSGIEVDGEVWFTAHGARPVTDLLPQETLDASGRVTVDEHLRIRGSRTLFAVGDITDVPEPKTAANAERQAAVAAQVIADLLAGREPRTHYTPSRYAVLAVPLGPRDGATQLPLLGHPIVGAAFTRRIKGQDLLLTRYRTTLRARA